MKVYSRVGQTKYIKNGLKGLLTIHDTGTIAGSGDHKDLFNGLNYKMVGGYRSITSPTSKEKGTIMDRLFDF